MPAPTIGNHQTRVAPGQTATTGNTAKTTPAIPFMRASRKRSLLFNFPSVPLTTAAQVLPPIQLPAAGYLRFLELNFVGTTAGNSAAVAFTNDGPFEIIQQISLMSANGDMIISPIDGISLYAENKYGGFSFGLWQPQLDPSWLLTAGGGATGGSFNFTLFVPVEVDSRDAFGALENMAANQSYVLTVLLNPAASIYSTAPTTLPQVVVTGTMHYYSAPAETSPNGDLQQVAPLGNGSVSLIQYQTPPIVPNSVQNIQMVNVGNTIRQQVYILRNTSNLRDSTQWPTETDIYINNDKIFAKTRTSWLAQLQNAYDYYGAPVAAAGAAVNALDAGIFVLIDFMNEGSVGACRVDASQERNLWLVTGSATAFNFEAHNWGPTAGSFLILQNTIRPASPQALYAPQYV